MKIQVPEKAKKIIDTLNAAGYEAYAVGGCVRDSVLGREPQDWDITTSAKPRQSGAQKRSLTQSAFLLNAITSTRISFPAE